MIAVTNEAVEDLRSFKNFASLGSTTCYEQEERWSIACYTALLYFRTVAELRSQPQIFKGSFTELQTAYLKLQTENYWL